MKRIDAIPQLYVCWQGRAAENGYSVLRPRQQAAAVYVATTFPTCPKGKYNRSRRSTRMVLWYGMSIAGSWLTQAIGSVLTAAFAWNSSGATTTSDAGLLACRELDDALGLTETA